MDDKKKKRGRPTEITDENRPRKWELKINNHDGTHDIWKFDLDKMLKVGMDISRGYGPISVETVGKRIDTTKQSENE